MSMHEQVGFPTVIYCADEMPDEEDMVGTHGLAQKRHPGFIGRPVAFSVVTFHARRYKILPRVFALPRLWHDVIYRQRHSSIATVLAPEVIATKNIFTGKNNTVRDADVDGEPHYAGHR